MPVFWDGTRHPRRSEAWCPLLCQPRAICGTRFAADPGATRSARQRRLLHHRRRRPCANLLAAPTMSLFPRRSPSTPTATAALWCTIRRETRLCSSRTADRPLAQPAPNRSPLSSHIMHAGYMVRNRFALDHFYKDLLGFHLYWQGGDPAESRQLGDDAGAGRRGLDRVHALSARASFACATGRRESPRARRRERGRTRSRSLSSAGLETARGRDPKLLGVDGKIQLDLTDPDGTRVEFMEFKPVKDPCCSPYTGTQPSPSQPAGKCRGFFGFTWPHLQFSISRCYHPSHCELPRTLASRRKPGRARSFRSSTDAWWLLVLCRIFDANDRTVLILTLRTGASGPERLAEQMGVLRSGGGRSRPIAAGLWNATKHSSWLMILNGLACSALGTMMLLATGRRLGFRTIALLIVLMAVSLGVYAFGAISDGERGGGGGGAADGGGGVVAVVAARRRVVAARRWLYPWLARW